MNIDELRRNWDEFGKKDPLWAILTDPRMKGGKWNPKAFFETGRAQVAETMAQLNGLGIAIPRGKCLDFGCGIGRLTQALCDHFDECCGVDIAPSMIELAQTYNRHPDRCRYYLNTFEDLRIFDDNTFDFVYSYIVLQHMRPEYSKSYIKEFLRVLRPGGLVIFQLPSARIPVVERYRLPDSAFTARIALDRPPTRVRPNRRKTLLVRIKNCGAVTWPATFPTDGACLIRLGNHWLDADGNMVVCDDGRTRLPRDVRPGEEIVVPLTITGPEQPGRYTLELDLVQELVAWFKDRGSEPLRVPVVNRAGAFDRVYGMLFDRPRKPPAVDDQPPAVMEMYSVERAEVIDLVRRHGGTVVGAREDTFSGNEWLSYSYFVVKQAIGHDNSGDSH